MRLDEQQQALLEALEIQVQNGNLKPQQRDALIEGIPALKASVQAVTTPAPDGLERQEHEAYPEEYFSIRSPFGDGARRLRLRMKDTGPQLRSLIDGFNSTQALARQEWSNPVKSRLTSAAALLREAIEIVGSGSVEIGGESSIGRPIDVKRRSLLEGLAKACMRVGITPTTTPDGPFCVVACALLEKQTIPHLDLRRAIDAAQSD